ncbi:hypothetical protein GPALN_005756 [Globodera pallida]|nr:hypothetical protein GPALN_005756 [Globodera pallida]
MKDIEGTKRALCYHYNFVARIVGVVDKWTTGKRAWTEFVDKKRIVELIKGKIPLKQLETELRTWKMKKCETVEQQHQTISDYTDKELGKKYMEEILALLESNKRARILQLLAANGAKTILIGFIGKKHFDELDESAHLLEIFPSYEFQNDQTLWDNYEKTLSDKSALGIHSKIVADLFVFLRWLYQQILVERNMQILWNQMHKFFNLQYDALFVEDTDFFNAIEKLGQIYSETKQFVENEILDKMLEIESKYEQELLKSKWTNKIGKAMEKAKQFDGPQLDEFIHKIHQKEILAMLQQEDIKAKFLKILSDQNIVRFALFVDFVKLYEDHKKLNGNDENEDDDNKQFLNIKEVPPNPTEKLKNSNSKNRGILRRGQEIAKEFANDSKNKQEMTNQIDDYIESYGCPDKKLTQQQLAAIDEEKNDENGLVMILSFIEHFKKDDENLKKENGQCRPIELNAFLWLFTDVAKKIKNCIGTRTELQQKNTIMPGIPYI